MNDGYTQSNQQNEQSLQGQQYQLPMSLEVKITSHIQGQPVPLGDLTISGMSTDDVSTTCEVYVDRNDLSPYQRVTARGLGGLDDYSRWIFTYSPPYASITLDNTNELTAKLSCLNNPTNLTAFYTVNVTGTASDPSNAADTAELTEPMATVNSLDPAPDDQEIPPLFGNPSSDTGRFQDQENENDSSGNEDGSSGRETEQEEDTSSDDDDGRAPSNGGGAAPSDEGGENNNGADSYFGQDSYFE